jgi:hypothetical protein
VSAARRARSARAQRARREAAHQRESKSRDTRPVAGHGNHRGQKGRGGTDPGGTRQGSYWLVLALLATILMVALQAYLVDLPWIALIPVLLGLAATLGATEVSRRG